MSLPQRMSLIVVWGRRTLLRHCSSHDQKLIRKVFLPISLQYARLKIILLTWLHASHRTGALKLSLNGKRLVGKGSAFSLILGVVFAGIDGVTLLSSCCGSPTFGLFTSGSSPAHIIHMGSGTGAIGAMGCRSRRYVLERPYGHRKVWRRRYRIRDSFVLPPPQARTWASAHPSAHTGCHSIHVKRSSRPGQTVERC